MLTKEQKAKRLREWRAKNKNRVKTHAITMESKHPGYARMKQREFHINYPNYEKEYLDKNIGRLLLKLAKARAKKRKLHFSLTLAWIQKKLDYGKCEQTGLPFSFTRGINDALNGRNPWFPSIDRINSSFGYNENNCQLVCCIYNLGKADWTDAEMLTMARAIVALNDEL